LRDVEDLLAERGIMVSYETVRRWVNHFGPATPHEFQGCTLVPFGLEQNVQDLTLRIDGTPEIDQTAADPEEDFIEMPDAVRLGPPLTQAGRNALEPPRGRRFFDSEIGILCSRLYCSSEI
jgi:hypothetical protein